MSTYPIEMGHIVDFYYLDAMVASKALRAAKLQDAATVAEKRMNQLAAERWERDATMERDRMVAQLALSFRNYLFVAGVGEMRHATKRCKMWFKELPEGITRSDACGRSLEYSPKENLNLLVEGFEQPWLGGSFGGLKWADCMKAGQQHGIWPDSVFVDHAVDLEHNGGSVFDKGSAAELVRLGLHFRWDHRMKTFLDIKRDTENLLTYNPLKNFTGFPITGSTFSLLVRWWNIFMGGPPSWVKDWACYLMSQKNGFTPWPTYFQRAPVFGIKIFTKEGGEHGEQMEETPTLGYQTSPAYQEYAGLPQEGEERKEDDGHQYLNIEDNGDIVEHLPQERSYTYLPS